MIKNSILKKAELWRLAQITLSLLELFLFFSFLNIPAAEKLSFASKP